jgi:hypothetical protein
MNERKEKRKNGTALRKETKTGGIGSWKELIKRRNKEAVK